MSRCNLDATPCAAVRWTEVYPHAKYTKDSENYTKKMVQLIHKAFLNHCMEKNPSLPAAIAICALKHSASTHISVAKIMASSECDG